MPGAVKMEIRGLAELQREMQRLPRAVQTRLAREALMRRPELSRATPK